MKYYATQFGANGSLTRQIELGDAVSIWETIGSVSNTAGDCFWYRDRYFGVIYADGTQPTPTYYDINALGEFTNEPHKIYDMKLSRDGTYLYILSNSTGSDGTLTKIATADLSSIIVSVRNGIQYTSRILVDRNDFVWMENRNTAFNNALIYRYSGSDLSAKGSDPHTSGRTIAMDARGYCWGWHYWDQADYFSRWMENPANPTAIIENAALNPNCRLANILDAVCWSDGTNHYAYILQNEVADTTTVNKIYKIDLTNPDAPADPVAITLTGLTNCYNLHVDYAGSIYFSSYGLGGYITYKIDKTTHIITTFSGVGTQTIGNDPFAYFLSNTGHTGVV